MNPRPRPIPILLPCALALGLAACAPALPPPPGGPQTWIDAPLQNAVLPLAPYNVISHANSPDGVGEFELSVNGQVVSTDMLTAPEHGKTLAYTSQAWTPLAPGSYLLTVRAADVNGNYGQKVEVLVIVAGGPTATAMMLPPTPSPSVGPAQACTFIAAINLFCRSGPGGQYPDVDSFTPGMAAPVVGMSTDGNYWYVDGPHGGGLCTVPLGDRFGQTTGACDPLPRFTPIPPPVATPTPAPTATPTATPTNTPIPPPS